MRSSAASMLSLKVENPILTLNDTCRVVSLLLVLILYEPL